MLGSDGSWKRKLGAACCCTSQWVAPLSALASMIRVSASKYDGSPQIVSCPVVTWAYTGQHARLEVTHWCSQPEQLPRIGAIGKMLALQLA